MGGGEAGGRQQEKQRRTTYPQKQPFVETHKILVMHLQSLVGSYDIRGQPDPVYEPTLILNTAQRQPSSMFVSKAHVMYWPTKRWRKQRGADATCESAQREWRFLLLSTVSLLGKTLKSMLRLTQEFIADRSWLLTNANTFR